MRLNLKLNDGTVRYTENVTTRKVTGTLTNLSNNNAIFQGIAKVTYGHGHYNEFEFDGKKQFWDRFLPCIEKELVREYS